MLKLLWASHQKKQSGASMISNQNWFVTHRIHLTGIHICIYKCDAYIIHLTTKKQLNVGKYKTIINQLHWVSGIIFWFFYSDPYHHSVCCRGFEPFISKMSSILPDAKWLTSASALSLLRCQLIWTVICLNNTTSCDPLIDLFRSSTPRKFNMDPEQLPSKQ